MEKTRLYYNNLGQIIWTSALEGPGKFPRSVADESKTLPDGTRCLELATPEAIADYQSREAIIVDGQVSGTLKPAPAPLALPRNALSELDDLKAALTAKGILPS